MEANQLVVDLLIVLAAGLFAGTLCKRIGISLLVGYLVIGAVIGQGGLGLVSQEHNELEYIARAGALLLLFSVGIEFSLEELVRRSWYILIGGAVQMLVVTVPLTFVCMAAGMSWQAALLSAAAGALSSTILVFKALAEWGQAETPHGRRAIGILLFQDIALVPLMLFVPLLVGGNESLSVDTFAWLLLTSALFVTGFAVLRFVIVRWCVPLLAGLRSVELVVLFTLTLLGAACWGSHAVGLPPAIGALAAGLVLSGNRLSKQIDTLVLPYRESFSVVFFVTLGTLLQPLAFFEEPLLLTAGLAGMLLLKSIAATVAMRLIGLKWKAAAGMGIGLAQLGEFSFLVVAEGVRQGMISPQDYNRMLFIALGTLILTPQLLKLGLRWTRAGAIEEPELQLPTDKPLQNAIVVGIGPIGRQIASRLELLGTDVCLIDLSPINLHPFAQQGFNTVAGDAREREVLMRANITSSRLAVVCVPDDETATQMVRLMRELNPTLFLLVRCRLLANVHSVRQAGADLVVSEEQEASGALLRQCEDVVRQSKEMKWNSDAETARND